MNQIHKLLKKGETETSEFKKSLSEIKEIITAISAFSNSKGGLILIGVNDNKDISGVNIGKTTLENLINNIKRETDPQIFPSITVTDIENKEVILIKVAESEDKPVFFKDKSYKRVGKTNQRISSSEMRKLVRIEANRSYWDKKICEGATLDDINEQKVKWFLQLSKNKRRLDLDSETPIVESLEKLELIKEGQLTNAAVLLFCNDPQKFFLQAEVRCARFKGTIPLEFIDMKVFQGNIIDQRESALNFVKEHIKLHAEIVDVERIETWEYPIEAVREAITNAICHRDYSLSSNIQVRIFDDRLEVWGCGPLPAPITVEDLKVKHRSVLRNPLIGNCFFLIKFIKHWGTGTQRILDACLDRDLPEPLFEVNTNDLIVIFRKYMVTDEILEGLNVRQRKAVEYLLKHNKITNKEYQEINNVSPATARRDLNQLVVKKVLINLGKKRSTYYQLQ
jgi:ATP-dependent DNA helicase RecG